MPTLILTVEVTPTSNTPHVPGLIGLGPNSNSNIHNSLNSSSGDTVLDRIFRQNVSTPNILTILLGRSNDPAEMYPGDITVGEILPGMESITNEPHVPVTSDRPADSGDQHWQVLIDANGIIGPDGNPIQVQTDVPSTANKNQLTAIFDTGFTLPQVPKCVLCIFISWPSIVHTIVFNKRAVSDALYSGIPGASLQNVDGLGSIWIIPCDAEVNLMFKIGGQA